MFAGCGFSCSDCGLAAAGTGDIVPRCWSTGFNRFFLARFEILLALELLQQLPEFRLDEAEAPTLVKACLLGEGEHKLPLEADF